MAKIVLSGSVRRSVFGKLRGVLYFVLALVVHCIVLFAAAAPAMAVPCASASSGMLYWWGGDNNAQDIMGTHHGTVSGATYVPGMVAEALHFNGVNDYVDTGVWPTVGAFTIQMWVYIDSFNHLYYMAPFSQNLSSGNYFTFFTGSQEFGFQGYWSDGSVFDLRSDINGNMIVPPFGTGLWKHISVTYDGNVLTQYVDGQIQNQKGYAGKTLGHNQPLILGKGAAYPGGGLVTTYFDGRIDEAQVYNRALDAAEVALVYNAGAAGVCRPCAPIPPGALSLWKAEENANDSIGANNGTLQNGLTFAPGKVGRAFSLDGVDDYLSFGDVLDMGANDFSISVWINAAEFRDDLGVGAKVINKGMTSSGTPSNSGYGIRLVDEGGINKARFLLRQGGTAGSAEAVGLQTNQWYHLVGVREGTAIRMYLNGALANAATSAVALDTTTNVYFAIGALYRQPTDNAITEYFKGLIDEPAMYNRALSDSEVIALYNAGSTGTCYPGLVSWWKAESNGLDSVGSNHGTLEGGTVFDAGRVGQAFNFNGVSSYIQLADAPSLLFGTGDLSISTWLKTPATSTVTPIFVKELSDTYPYPHIILMLSTDGRIRFSVSDCGTGECGFPETKMPVYSSSRVDDDQWHHIVAVRDAAGYQIFIDGRSSATLVQAPMNGDSNFPAYIGGWPTPSQIYFSGMLDEVQLFKRALSADEVGLLFWGEYMVQRASGGQNYYYATPQSAYAAPAVTGDEIRMKKALFGPMTFNSGISIKLLGGYCIGSLFTDNSCGMTPISPQLIITSDTVELDNIEVQ